MERKNQAEADYLLVRFEGNSSNRWDGRETEVPSRTVVRSGRRGADGLEVAEVHWPGKGGKGKKLWKCVVLEGEAAEEEAEAAVPSAKRPRTRAESEEPLQKMSATSTASAAGPGPGSASTHTPEPRLRHGPGRGKLELEERLGEQEAELLAQRGKELDRREQQLAKRERELEKKKRAGKGKGDKFYCLFKKISCVYSCENVYLHNIMKASFFL